MAAPDGSVLREQAIPDVRASGNWSRRGIHYQHKLKRKLQTVFPFQIADCRLAVGQACMLIRLQDVGADFGAICHRLTAHG
jgi:hypothetical protein